MLSSLSAMQILNTVVIYVLQGDGNECKEVLANSLKRYLENNGNELLIVD